MSRRSSMVPLQDAYSADDPLEPRSRRASVISTSLSTISVNPLASLRSEASMRGLALAETGAGMVELDYSSRSSAFKESRNIVPESMSPAYFSDHPQQPSLVRHGTLLSACATPERHTAELKSILGNANSRLKPGASIPITLDQNQDRLATCLEQAKPRARVEVDIALENNVCVQGSYLKGHIKIRIRNRNKKEHPVLIAGGKIRVIGFECVKNESDRNTFYMCSASLSQVSTAANSMYFTCEDEEGFAQPKTGVHVLPFSMLLALEGEVGNSKGVISSHAGAALRYIAMFSIKVKEADTGKRSIAHFYRDCEIWPRLNPSVILAPGNEPLQASSAKGIFRGGGGKISIVGTLNRLHWIAGQQCYVKLEVLNTTNKQVKSINLALIRSTVVYKPHGEGSQDSDACQGTTSHKQVAESTLEMAQGGARGHASAKGWWSGIEPGQTMEFGHFILLPPDTLSVQRSRLLEVTYSIRVSVSAGSLAAAVQVTLPVRIVNFLSIDPPPSGPPVTQHSTRRHVGNNVQSLHSKDSYRSSRPGLPEELNPRRDEVSIYESLDGNDKERSFTNAEQFHDAQEDGDDGDRQLGNLSLRDDTDDVVQQAISSAKIDTKYGQDARRFADLYFTSIQDGMDRVKDEAEREPDIVEETIARLKGGQDRDMNEMTSFAQRVRDKMQEAEESGKFHHREADVEPSLSTSDSYFRARHEMPDEVEKAVEPEVPLPPLYVDARSTTSSSTASEFSIFSPNGSEGASSVSDVDSTGNSGYRSRVLPKSPEDVLVQPKVFPFQRARAQSITIQPSETAVNPRIRALSMAVDDLGLTKPPGVAITANGGPSSVKDKIRQFEQRVQVESVSLEATGPL